MRKVGKILLLAAAVWLFALLLYATATNPDFSLIVAWLLFAVLVVVVL